MSYKIQFHHAIESWCNCKVDEFVLARLRHTKLTLIGPFFLTPTPNKGRLPRLSSNLIFVAESINA